MSITKLCFTDVETGGTDHKTDALLQMAGQIAYLDAGVLSVKDKFNYFIQPFEKDIIYDEALAVNHILREDLNKFDAPNMVYKGFTSILNKHVNKFDKFDKMFFVGYNSTFDYSFVRTWFEKNGDKYMGSYFWVPSIDVMQMAILYLMGERVKLPNFKLGTVANYLNITADGDLHDADVDIEVTAKLFMFLYEKLRPFNN